MGLSFVNFMNGLVDAPWSGAMCRRCGGTGWEPIYCCSGADMACGCQGLPVNFKACVHCDCTMASDEQILEWAVEGRRRRDAEA
jgi:hypothetical protein